MNEKLNKLDIYKDKKCIYCNWTSKDCSCSSEFMAIQKWIKMFFNITEEDLK